MHEPVSRLRRFIRSIDPVICGQTCSYPNSFFITVLSDLSIITHTHSTEHMMCVCFVQGCKLVAEEVCLWGTQKTQTTIWHTIMFDKNILNMNLNCSWLLSSEGSNVCRNEWTLFLPCLASTRKWQDNKKMNKTILLSVGNVLNESLSAIFDLNYSRWVPCTLRWETGHCCVEMIRVMLQWCGSDLRWHRVIRKSLFVNVQNIIYK